jgi:hypothetical protein
MLIARGITAAPSLYRMDGEDRDTSDRADNADYNQQFDQGHAPEMFDMHTSIVP